MRVKLFLTCGLMAALTFGGMACRSQADENGMALTAPYEVRDYSSLLGMKGFSDKALETHFKLYGGYVKNTNLLLAKLDEMARSGTNSGPEFAELRRRLGWEFDGMRLHELYFENLGSTAQLAQDSKLAQAIERHFGSYTRWEEDFANTGKMRGIGWVVLYQDPVSGRLINTWINEHDMGHLSGAQPILIMDVFEHAYMVDYLLDRGSYIRAFLDNANWAVAEGRLVS